MVLAYNILHDSKDSFYVSACLLFYIFVIAMSRLSIPNSFKSQEKHTAASKYSENSFAME